VLHPKWTFGQFVFVGLKVWLCYWSLSQTFGNNYTSLKKLITNWHLLVRELVNWLQPWPSKPQSTWINHVTHVFHVSMKQPTLVWMKFKIMFFKFSKYFLQMMHVIS
jgi:hypothetical protein